MSTFDVLQTNKRLVSNCHTKCLQNTYPEGDLNAKESVCVDRCVAKYFETNLKVGETMQKVGGALSGMR